MQATLQEQLRATLSKWEKEEKEQAAQQAQPKTSPFQVSNNLNRTAFREIKDQPDTRKRLTDRLIAQGFKLGSVSAVIGHMIRQGVAVVGSDGVLRVTTPEYVPLKSYKTLQNMKKRQAQGRGPRSPQKKTLVASLLPSLAPFSFSHPRESPSPSSAPAPVASSCSAASCNS